MQTKKNITPKKSLGQNFLQNKSICQKIVLQSGVDKDDLILEIGPGQLALTQQLINTCKNFVLIEKDKECFDFIINFFSNNNYTITKHIEEKNNFVQIANEHHNILLFNFDALKINIQDVIHQFNQTFNGNFNNLKIVANLPYNVATLLIYKWCEHDYSHIASITIMIQKEVAKRIAAKINSKDYGKLSVMCQILFECKILFDVSQENFFPKPKVMSSIINLTKLQKSGIDVNKIKIFGDFLTKMFSNRRKNLLNVLKSSGLDFSALKNESQLGNAISSNILSKRIEDLNPRMIIDLFNRLVK